MTTEVTYVRVHPVTHRTSIQVILLPHTEIPRRLVRITYLPRVVLVL